MAGVLRLPFGWPEQRVRRATRAVVRTAGDGVISPRKTISALTSDPDDNRILECAVDGKADLIVSNDHHLIDLKSYGSSA
jgi:predicted nucleic acid-binding protein